MGVGLVSVCGVAAVGVHVGRVGSKASVRGHIMTALQPVIGSQTNRKCYWCNGA